MWMGVLKDVLLVFCVVVCSVMWLGVLMDALLVLCGCVFCYVDGCSGGFLEIHCFVVLSIVSLANLVCA